MTSKLDTQETRDKAKEVSRAALPRSSTHTPRQVLVEMGFNQRRLDGTAGGLSGGGRMKVTLGERPPPPHAGRILIPLQPTPPWLSATSSCSMSRPITWT